MTWLTVTQVARRIGISPRWVRKMMDPEHPEFIPNTNIPTKPSPRFPAGRPRYRIDEEDLEKWLAAHATEVSHD